MKQFTKTVLTTLSIGLIVGGLATLYIKNRNDNDFVETAQMGQINNIPVLDITLKRPMSCDQVMTKLEIGPVTKKDGTYFPVCKQLTELHIQIGFIKNESKDESADDGRIKS